MFNWNAPFFHNHVSDWIIAGILLLLALFGARPLAALIARVTSTVIRKFSHRENKRAYAEVIRRPLGNLLALLFLYGAVLRLAWPFNFVIYTRHANEKNAAPLTLLDTADRIFLFLIIVQLALVLARTVDFAFRLQIEKAQEGSETDRLQLFPLMRDVAKILLWTMAFFWVLGSVFSVNIPALIAGLGIGGVAIALAAKESVENFFAAFTILTDKPFQTGETIRLGDLEGSVERIGFRSTRLRHADGSIFIIPNRTLVGQNVENVSQRTRTRVQLKVLLRNDLPVEALGTLIDTLETRIAQTENVRPPVSVNLSTFGKSVIEILLSYHLPVPSVGDVRETEIKQDIALKIYALLSQYAVVESAKEPDDAEAGKGLQEPGGKEDS